MTRNFPSISPEALAGLGGGKIAYVKAIRSEKVNELFPQAPQLAPGLQLFALVAADGTPTTVDSRPTTDRSIGHLSSVIYPQAAAGGGRVSTA